MQTGVSGKDRRLAVLLFADVVGSTNQLQGMDVEDVHESLNAAVEQMTQPIRTYGGTVARVHGEGVLAVFGMRNTAEDDALRACMAGMEIVERFNGSDAVKLEGKPLQVRVGIHAGPVMTFLVKSDAGAKHDVAGHAANLAGKIQQMAPTNSVAVSRTTLDLVIGSYEDRPIGELPGGQHNVPEPISEILQISPDFTLETQFSYDDGKALIGREKELQRLTAITQTGRGSIALVGDAGIGKSRLAYEMSRRADLSGVEKIEIRGLSYLKSVSYGALRATLRYALGITGESDISNLNERKGDLKLTDLQLTALRDVLGYGVRDRVYRNLEARDRVDVISDAVHKVLFLLNPDTERLLLVEDVHVLDELTLEVVQKVLLATRKLPVVALLTTRPERRDLVQNITENVVELAGLNPADAMSFSQELLAQQNIRSNVAAELAKRAEGNPFYIMEYARALLLSGGSDLDRLPISIEASIQARVDTLSKDARRVLEIICTAGGELSLKRLRQVYPDIDLIACLYSLRQAGFTEQPSPDTARVLHDFVLQATHENMLKASQRASHAALFEAMEQSDDAAQSPDRLAYHAHQAGKFERAIEYYWAAMLAEAGRSSVLAVADLYERALKACDAIGDDGNQRRAELTMLSFDALQQQGLYDLVKGELVRAIKIAETTKNDKLLAQALAHTATMAWLEADYPKALETSESAFKIAKRDGILPLEIYANFTRANGLHATGRLSDSIALHLEDIERLSGEFESLKLGAIGFPSVISRAFAVWYLSQKGDFREAEALIPRGLQLAEVYSQPYSIILMYVAIGLNAYSQGRYSKAIEAFKASYDLCLDEKVYAMLARVGSALAHLYVRLDRADEALSVLSNIFENSLHLKGGRINWVYASAALAESWAALGHQDWADTAISNAGRLAEENGEPSNSLMVALCKAELDFNAGRDRDTIFQQFGDLIEPAIAYDRYPIAASAKAGRALIAVLENHKDAAERLKEAERAYISLDLMGEFLRLEDIIQQLSNGELVRYHSNIV